MLNQTGQQSLGQKVLSAGVGLIKAVAIGGAMGVGAALVSSLISKTKSSQVVYAPMSSSVKPSATQIVPATASPIVITPTPSVSPVYVPLSCDLEGLPLSSTVVAVKAKDRIFPGICLSDTLKFTCAGRDFQVSMDVVNKITGNHYCAEHRWYVTLADGSMYVAHDPYDAQVGRSISEIEFVTVAGRQTVTGEELLSVQGATDLQLDVLKHNLELAFQANLQSIINTIGQNLVNQFFNLGQFNVPGLQQAPTPIASIGPSIPATPSGLFARVASSGSSRAVVDVSWRAVSGATGYYIYRDTNVSGNFPRLTATNNTSYSEAVNLHTRYCYKVSAYNNAGESGMSSIFAVHT